MKSRREKIEAFVNDVNRPQGKTDLCLRIDCRLADEARQHFKGDLSRIFEIAIRDALEIKQQRKGNTA